jgi:hypothetical protein
MWVVSESVEQRQSPFHAATGMPPPRADLTSSGKPESCILDRHAGRFGGERRPALLEQRHPTRRHAPRPHRFERFIPDLDRRPDSGDCQELGIEDIQIIAGGEAVDGVDDVRACPADELLPDIDGEPAPGHRGSSASERRTRPPVCAVREVERIVDLVV